MMIRIKLSDLEKIFFHCSEELPIEACGILAGKNRSCEGVAIKEVLKVYNCKNELYSPTEFRIRAEEQFKIFSEIEDLDLRLLGFYHSHVSHPYTFSRPSSVDEERANYIGYSHLIITLNPKKVSSWILENKGIFKEEVIETIE
ncbi:MAG: [CysO sulfur-carrier protein]-S-L-cysteine hydrolase [Thermoproteota archaeon]|nr:[CysO sulfur-carrier protein]-S-L-cysteine hydrolase [Thermoproteota archaeon]